MVLAAAIFFALCLVFGLIVAALAALGLWRTIKRRGGEVADLVGTVSAGGEAAGRAAGDLERRRSQLEHAGAELTASAQAAAVLGQAAATGVVMVLFPLRFLIDR